MIGDEVTMTNTDKMDISASFSHRSAYSFNGSVFQLNCSGFDADDKLLIIRLLAASVLFLLALVLKVPGWVYIVLLEVSAFTAAFDVVISAVYSVRTGKLRDPCIVITVVGITLLLCGQFRDEAAVFLLFQIFELLLRLAAAEVQRTLFNSACIDIAPAVTALRGGQEINTPVNSLEENEQIVLHPGSVVPVDCVVTEGGGAINVSAITGSNTPVTVSENDVIYSGSVVVGSDLVCQVLRVASESAAQKLNAVTASCAEAPSVTSSKFKKLTDIFLITTAAAAVLTAILVPILSDAGFIDGLGRAASVLSLAVPSVYLVSVPLSYLAVGAKQSHEGVIFRNTAAVEAAAELTGVVYDKNGTLTSGDNRVTSVKSDKMDAQMMLKIAAHAEAYSSHPIAKAIINAYGGVIYIELVQKFREFPGEGIAAMMQDIPIIIGSQHFLERLGISVRVDGGVENAVFMAVKGVYAGRFIFGSPMLESAATAVHKLRECGIADIAMISPDSHEAAEVFAQNAGIPKFFTSSSLAETAEILGKMKNPDTTMYVFSDNSCAQSIPNVGSAAVVGTPGSSFECGDADILVFGSPDKLAEAVSGAKRVRKNLLGSLLACGAASLILLVLSLFGIASAWFIVFVVFMISLALVLFSARHVFPTNISKA